MVKHLVTLSLAAYVFPPVAHAQVRSTGVLDDALRHFRTAAEGWQNAMEGAATSLFWSLAAISLVWTMGQLALRRADLAEFFFEFIRYVLFTGFWDWMLRNGPHHASLIVDSMGRLAAQATGVEMPSPSGVLDVGFHLLDRALVQSSILSPVDGAIGIVLAIVILVVLALVGKDMLYTLAACWVVGYAGQFVLGFGGSRWTSDIAFNYYRKVLSLALHVLGLILVVGVGAGFLRGYYDALEQDMSVHELAVLLVVSIVFVGTVRDVPPMLGGLANGASFAGFGGGGGAGAALSTASGAVALAATVSRPAAEAVGQLAKAAAIAAVGGAGLAAATLLDGFRSGYGGRSPSASGGRVFPAPPPAPGSENATSTMLTKESALAHALSPRSDPSAGLGPQGSHDDQSSERPEAGVRPAVESDHLEPDKPSPRDNEAELAQHASDEHDAATDAARVGTTGGRHTARASATSDEALSKSERSGSPAGNASAGGAPSSPPPRTAAKVPTSEAASASPPGSGHGIPAGTFTSPSPTTAPPTTPPSTQPISAPPTSLSGQPSSTSAQPVSAAPTSALAGATARELTMPHDVPFTNPTTVAEAMHSPQPPGVVTPAPTAARAELPAAYGAQIEVDVEAEVAAFRDKE